MRWGPLAALLLVGHAGAATLAADSLLCESPAELEFVRAQDWLRGKPAGEMIEKAGLSVKAAEMHENLGRQMSLRKTTDAERSQTDGLRRVASSCAPSQAGSAEVLERRSISGLARIRTAYQGRPAELWTYASALTE